MGAKSPDPPKQTSFSAFERELEQLHPDKRHIRDKIRQQLQVLRDMGLLEHMGTSEWRLR